MSTNINNGIQSPTVTSPSSTSSSSTTSTRNTPSPSLKTIALAYGFFSSYEKHTTLNAEQFEEVKKEYVDLTGTEKRGISLVVEVVKKLPHLNTLQLYLNSEDSVQMNRRAVSNGQICDLQTVQIRRANKNIQIISKIPYGRHDSPREIL